jgi:hypothetical protein
MDEEEVENLRKVYNREHPSEPEIPQGSIKSVWGEIRKRLHDLCKAGTTECIIKSMINKPNAPDSWVANPDEWLSSIEIDDIEKEFVKLFKKYYYVGAIPIDFDKKNKTGSCIVSSLCSLNIKDIYDKGKRQIGIIFNTDVSTGVGQHWIALFADVDPEYEYARITYFDSYSKFPEPEIQRLMKRWAQQWDATGVHSKPTQLTYNKTHHQYKDSECGMYCIYFHYCCLLGIPMQERVPDEVVHAFRSMLFSIGKK